MKDKIQQWKAGL